MHAGGGVRRRTVLRLLLTSAVAVTLLVSATNAEAAPLWSSVPTPFACNRSDNGCLSQTGFNPMKSFWGQDTNPKGNCTNYAAYRLQRNGATSLRGSGNAISWRSRVQNQFGPKAVNLKPRVGSIAWWGSSVGAAGHVAYVERVSGSS